MVFRKGFFVEVIQLLINITGLFMLRLITILMAAVLTACSTPETFVRISGETMGTTYSAVWMLPDVKSLKDEGVNPQTDLVAEAIQPEIDQLLVNINKSMSTYDPTSELSLLNKKFSVDLAEIEELNQWQNISLDLYRVMMMSMMINRASEGYFDVTVGPMVNLWGFGPNHTLESIPSDQQIDKIKKSTGAEVIDLRLRDEGYQMMLMAARYIDLSAIAKGYAVDQVAELLQEKGIDNYLVEIGGEIAVRGDKGSKGKWTLAIEKPDVESRTVQKLLSLENQSLATSGDYRNYFESDGVKYSHTIDPFTGKPVKHQLASVSVVHESTTMADGWATAFSAMGAEKGLELANKLSIAAYFIVRTDTSFNELSSEEFKKLTDH